jgi:hypothetical protein
MSLFILQSVRKQNVNKLKIQQLLTNSLKNVCTTMPILSLVAGKLPKMSFSLIEYLRDMMVLLKYYDVIVVALIYSEVRMTHRPACSLKLLSRTPLIPLPSNHFEVEAILDILRSLDVSAYITLGRKCRYLGESSDHKNYMCIECLTNRIFYLFKRC